MFFGFYSDCEIAYFFYTGTKLTKHFYKVSLVGSGVSGPLDAWLEGNLCFPVYKLVTDGLIVQIWSRAASIISPGQGGIRIFCVGKEYCRNKCDHSIFLPFFVLVKNFLRYLQIVSIA